MVKRARGLMAKLGLRRFAVAMLWETTLLFSPRTASGLS
jgi:hypothetical protein